MRKILRKIISRLRVSLFPTEQDKEIKRWCSDGGDESLRFDYDINSDSVVIDLGGYKGQWASDIYARYNCCIFVFEPVKSFADRISIRFSNNPNIQVFNLALGAKSRQELINVCEDSSSVHGNGALTESFHFEDVVKFFEQHDISHVDLMKINIEGGEYELLVRLIDTGLIKKIRAIQVQFHNVFSDAELQMKQIHRELAKTHTPTYQYKFVWENWERIDI